MYGDVLQLTGASGIATGRCRVNFDVSEVIVIIGGHVALRIPFEEITSLQVAGRGLLEHRSGGGWIGGGFGVSGAIEGAAIAGVLNALTTKQHYTVETILSLTWREGSLVLLHSQMPPTVLANQMEPVIGQIGRSAERRTAMVESTPRRPGPTDVAGQLASLVAMKDAGALTDAEFGTAKARLLQG